VEEGVLCLVNSRLNLTSTYWRSRLKHCWATTRSDRPKR